MLTALTLTFRVYRSRLAGTTTF